jgi:hypothetical protein
MPALGLLAVGGREGALVDALTDSQDGVGIHTGRL